MNSFGNGTIDRYPLLENIRIEKLLICTEKTFESLKKKFDQFKRQYPNKINVKKPQKKIQKNLSSSIVTPENIYHEFQPSNISYVYNSNFWRWRRVNEWFRENAQNQYVENSSLFNGNFLCFDDVVALIDSQSTIF